MDINRNNYEEYFLLYADDELSKAERKIVEVFVKENPEFREEFCMLKLTINIPDDEIKLEDKTFLFKNESFFIINKNNYEEAFIHYHDNELSEKEKLETENFVAQHPGLKSEFDLIGKAKLFSETSIVYPDKKELYRKEKSGKVIPMMRWRYAAVAVLIGFGLWVSVPYFTNHDTKTPVVAQTKETKSAESSTQNFTPKEPEKEKSQVASVAGKEPTIDNVIKKSNSEKPISQERKKNVIAKNEIVKNEVKMTRPSLTKNIQQLKQEPVEAVAIHAPDEKVHNKVENFQKSIEEEAHNPVENSRPEVQPNYAQTASFTDASANNNNYVFYDIPAEEFRKSKVGGFLKKVRRIVERTNPITRLLEGNDESVVANKF